MERRVALGFGSLPAVLASVAGAALSVPGVASAQADPAPAQASPDDVVADIVVTATRRSELLSKIPLSVSAFSRETLDRQGSRSLSDIVAYTPGIQTNPATNDISIRGISTGAGPSTTGLYIDDTPIELTNLGGVNTATAPRVFDVQRVEVLRGPQGTLFGGGAEGGVVRFILNQPSLTDYSHYVRAEINSVDNGQLGGEIGAAMGGPIVTDKIGFRVSGDFRRLPGFIDRIDYRTGDTVDKNANSGREYILRAALTFAPSEHLTITPSILRQHQYSRNDFPDSYRFSTYWSDRGAGKFRDNRVQNTPVWDSYWLPALAVNWDLGGASLIANTTYFSRNGHYDAAYTTYLAGLFGVVDQVGLDLPSLPGYRAVGDQRNRQRNFTQEVRLQSTDPDSRLRWTVGAYYARSRQFYQDYAYDPDADTLINALYGTTIAGVFGFPLTADGYSYAGQRRINRRQIAGFADVAWTILPGLTLDGGVRVSRDTFKYTSEQDGPYAGGYSLFRGSGHDTPVTPKVSLSYQRGKGLIYASVAKGYRPGGATRPPPAAFCAADLARLGYDSVPASYGSDHTINYEVGAKDSVFGGRLQFAGSVYRITWRDIQTVVPLPTCGSDFTANVGTARSQGFDLQADIRPIDPLTLAVAVGYSDAKYTKDILDGAGNVLIAKGNSLGSPNWTFSVSGTWKQRIGTIDTYLRVDDLYSSRADKTASTDPSTSSFVLGAINRPEFNTVSLRIGATFDAWDVSLFSTNLFNAHPMISQVYVPDFAPYSGTTIRPRVIGLTLTSNF